MEEVCLVTEDRWMKEEGGQIDATDRELLNAASQNGQFSVRVINLRDMLEALKEAEPEKFKQFRKEMERQERRGLTFDELVELGRKADQRMDEFTKTVSGMSQTQASVIRVWRVDDHMTWRLVARTAFFAGWYGKTWRPLSNQIMGMALCQKAAPFFQENYREAPWN